MRLSGALSNQATADALGALVDRKRRLGMVGINEDARPLIRLPQGAIQAAVLEVLADASGSLRAVEIHSRVQTRLMQSITRDTVTSFLSVGCRSTSLPVIRVGHGRYRIATNDSVSNCVPGNPRDMNSYPTS
jgi:hypothetical protein